MCGRFMPIIIAGCSTRSRRVSRSWRLAAAAVISGKRRLILCRSIYLRRLGSTLPATHQLPFNAGAFGGIAMLDVLHHLARPAAFFDEAARVLRPGGRLVMIEPGITPFSWPFYQFLHQEPVDMSVDPLADQPPEVAEDPFLSNQAIPTLLFRRRRRRLQFAARHPEFRVSDVQTFSLFAYPLSGGFKRWSLLPEMSLGPF